MPLTDDECSNCGRLLHSDDKLEGRCLGCGKRIEDMEEVQQDW